MASTADRHQGGSSQQDKAILRVLQRIETLLEQVLEEVKKKAEA